MREQQLSDHHSATSLDLVHVEVQGLKVGAVFEGFSEVLSTFTLNAVTHQVQIEESNRFADQVTKGTSSDIRDLVVSEVNLFDMDSISLEGRADEDDVVVSDAVSEHVLMVSVDNDINGIILIVSFFKVLNEGIVRLHASLLTLVFVEVDDVALDELSKIFNLLLAVHIHLLLHLVLLHILLVHHLFLLFRREILVDFYHAVLGFSNYFYNC